MTIKEMNAILRDKSKQNLTCNFKVTGGHEITLEDLMKEIKSIKTRLEEHDKMFRAHGWIK